MEPVATKRARLVAALEDLTAREADAIRLSDGGAIEHVQSRLAPVVTYLCEHASEITDPPLRARIAYVVARRQQVVAGLGADLERTRARLDALRTNQRRVASVAPVYGRPAATAAKRLSVVG